MATTRLIEPVVFLVVTIRHCAGLSPGEALIVESDLFPSMLWQPRKAADLQGNPWILVRSIITGRVGGDSEFKGLRPMQGRFAVATAAIVGWEPTSGRSHPFSVGIEGRCGRPVRRRARRRAETRTQRSGHG